MEYITLLGAEQVQTAANTMRSAASRMSEVFANYEGTARQHQIFMDDWLLRFEKAIEKLEQVIKA